MAAVDDAAAQAIEDAAIAYGMDVLVEVHDEDELDRALKLKSRLDRHQQPRSAHVQDLARRQRAPGAENPARPYRRRRKRPQYAGRPRTACQRIGISTFLIGESLMRQADVAAATRALLRVSRAARSGVAMARRKNHASKRRARESAPRSPRSNRLPPVVTHIDQRGEARMVDVSDKGATERDRRRRRPRNHAQGDARSGARGNAKKGDVLGAARLAGIMAAKRTHGLIPLCHPLPLSKVEIEINPEHALPGLLVQATVKVTGQTGVEMEALTAVSVACLTIYDMVKAVERGMRIEGIRLLQKSGGKSGEWRAKRM